MKDRFLKQPFAFVFQTILVIIMPLSFAMVAQESNFLLYRLGFVLLLASSTIQIVFGNIPPTTNFKQSMKLLLLGLMIIVAVFSLGIFLVPYLVNLGR
jgi:hypothetical protein